MTFEEMMEKRAKDKEGVIAFVDYATEQMVKELKKSYPNKSRVHRLRKEINQAVMEHFKNHY